MKKILAFSLAMATSVVVNAEVLYTFDFSSNGRLTNNTSWRAYSGADGSITNDGSQAWIGAGAEDVGATNVYAAQSGLVYLGLDVRVNSRGSGGQEYTVGFLSGANTMAGRVFMSITNAGGGSLAAGLFRLGLGGDGTAATLATDVLSLGTTYRVVVGYNNATDTHSLWINPTGLDELTPTLTITEAVTANPNGFFIRQANTWGSGGTSWNADNLVVATDFASVVPEPSTLAMFSLAAAALLRYRRRK